MESSPEKLKIIKQPGFPSLAKAARLGAPFFSFYSNTQFLKSLHRCILACCALGLIGIPPTLPVMAQEERPQIPVGERKPRKKDAGPRAVAVLRMGEKGKASLVPIAILMNGKFWDASAYKADPVPMSLEPGTVYEVEQTGGSLGLFTVNAALHSNSRNTDAPWIGTGAWHPTGADEPKPAIKADKAPVGIEADDNGPPRLTHDTSAAKAPAASSGSGAASGSSTSNAPSSSSNAPAGTSSKPSGSSGGDEPPRLSKGTAASPTNDPAAPAPKAPDKPSDSKPAIVAEGKSNIPASDSGTAEANRPKLRRGKPAEYVAEEDVPGYSRPGAASAASGEKASAAKEPDVKLIPAISDAAGPTPHPYTFQWLRDEEGERRKQITELAKQQVQAYVAAREKASNPATQSANARVSQKRGEVGHPGKRTSAKVSEPILENEQMKTFDLWNSNQPVIVFSAEAHMPPAPGASSAPNGSADLQYSIMLVAYPDIYNNLHKLYSAVTDRFHLDMTPKLELVDAVDADGDGRGDLLFRETSDLGSGWVIYRATADKLYKMFDSLNAD